MKMLKFFWILLVFPTLLSAQPYFFSRNVQTYTEITGGASVNGSSVWSTAQAFTIPIGFTFNFMGTNYTTVKVEATGRLIFDANHYYFFDGFAVYGLRDKGTSSSLSPITYALSGTPGNQILKIQFKDATYSGDLTATVNFQLWVHENGTLEIHMGPTTVNNMTAAIGGNGGSSGVFHLSGFGPPVNHVYALMAYGNPSSPSDSSFSGNTTTTSALGTFPILSNGTMYRYGLSSTSGISESTSSGEELVKTNDGRQLGLSNQYRALEYSIFDLKGSILKSGLIPESLILDVSTLNKGIYVIQVAGKKSKFAKL